MIFFENFVVRSLALILLLVKLALLVSICGSSPLAVDDIGGNSLSVSILE
jgi:hypothetical protein